MLRVEAWAHAHQPDVVVRVGDLWASKVVNQWLAATPEHVIVDRHGVWIEPDRRAARRVQTTASALSSTLAPLVAAVDADWRASWTCAEEIAQRVIDEQFAAPAALSEPLIAHAVVALAADDSVIVAASSMPVRDIEWYAGGRDRVVHYANRGANGIDGVVSTAIGVALGGRRVVALVGDIAFLHDSSALIALARRPIDLTIVVVDNDGGGIFSFLTQADALEHDRFELLFGTPHGTDIAALARAHHLDAVCVDSSEQFRIAYAKAVGAAGVRVIVARTDRADNVVAHRRIHEAIARAIGG